MNASPHIAIVKEQAAKFTVSWTKMKISKTWRLPRWECCHGINESIKEMNPIWTTTDLLDHSLRFGIKQLKMACRNAGQQNSNIFYHEWFSKKEQKGILYWVHKELWSLCLVLVSVTFKLFLSKVEGVSGTCLISFYLKLSTEGKDISFY